MNVKEMFKLAYGLHRSHSKAVASGKSSGRGNEFLLSLTPKELAVNQRVGMEAWLCLHRREDAEYLHGSYLAECKRNGNRYLDLQHRFF